MTTNTDETFIRTSPPLNRFTVIGRAVSAVEVEILGSADARRIAQDITKFVAAEILSGRVRVTMPQPGGATPNSWTH